MPTKPNPNRPVRYDGVAICFHWLVAFGLIATFALGMYMQDLPLSPGKLKLYSWHKWAGVSLFVLVCLRLAWRWSRPAVPLPDTISPLMKTAARRAHALLYILMLAIPVTGWLSSSAQGVPVVWFGVLPLPNLVDRSPELAEVLQATHLTLNYSLLALVVVHVLASLKHHFVDKDSVLYSMLPVVRKR